MFGADYDLFMISDIMTPKSKHAIIKDFRRKLRDDPSDEDHSNDN